MGSNGGIAEAHPGRQPLPHRHARVRRRPGRGDGARARGGRRGHAAHRRNRRGAGAPPRPAGGGRAGPAGLRPASTRTRRGWRPPPSTTSSAPWRAGKRIVAIGEIGLDFHYDHSPRDAQREAFRAQVRLAREVNLPVIIHTREADDETAALLEEEGRHRGRHPLLHRRPRAGPPCPRPRLLHLLLRDHRVPTGRGHPGSRAHDPPRPAAGRDRQPVPGPAAAPRQAQRARVRGRGRADDRPPARRAAGGGRSGRAGELPPCLCGALIGVDDTPCNPSAPGARS